MRLSAEEIDVLPVPSRPTKVHDGHGCFLLLRPDGSRYWRQNYMWAGKRKTLSLGVYPVVSVDMAREESRRMRAVVEAGDDPSAIRQEARHAAKVQERAAAEREPARFLIDQGGALTVCLSKRLFVLSRAEAVELSAFLKATESVGGAEDV